VHQVALEKPDLDHSRDRAKNDSRDRPTKQHEVLAPGTVHLILLILNRNERSLLRDRLHRFNLNY
jgi:hypothetical protein